MTRFIQATVYAVISLTLTLFLLTTAEGRTAPKPESSKRDLIDFPVFKSVAETWSFQNEIQKSALEYLRRVEANAKMLIRSRYKFDRRVKLPDYSTDLSSKAHVKDERLNGTIHLVNGWANGFPNISLVGENTVSYAESTIKFHSDVKLWRHLVVVYEYEIFEDCREFKGKIVVDNKDALYSLTTAFDISTKVMELADFKGKTNGTGDSRVEGLEGNSRLSRILTTVTSGFYRDAVLPDIETFLRTVLEDSVKNVSVSDLLPKADYEGDRPAPQFDGEGLEICETDAEEESKEDALPWESVTELPFIQNTGEMWAFQEQMNNGLRRLMEQVAVRTAENLAERKLLRGKLTDDRFLMNIMDQTSTARHAPMFLSNGWFSSPFNFSVSKVRQVEFRDGAVDFTASCHLEDPLEFVYDFKALFLREDYEGDVRGSAKFVEYVLTFSLDLETAALYVFEDPKLDCAREISVVVTGLQSAGEWFHLEVKKNILQRFRDSTLPQIHVVLSRAFDYVASEMSAEQFLPKWSYDRDFRTDFGLRVGEHDEDAADICEAERVRKAEERTRRFSKLIGEDGVFNDVVPDADGKYFTHVSGVKNIGIRFTSTKTQSWYFDRDLRLKMNEYLYTLLRTTTVLILIRGLGKVRMPDYREAANDKYDKEMRIEKCWVDGLNSVAVTGVDVMEYDQRVITLITNILVYKDLKFEGEYRTIGPKGGRDKGKIVVQLPPVELSLRIEIDYLGEKKAKLDYMKLECVGANSSGSYPQSRVDRVSDSVDVYFREVMVEHLFVIFRRAFEDAMVNTKLEEFLPEWDYKRDYISEIILHQNVNRFQTTVEYCNSTESDKLSLKEFYPDLETVEFSRFLPEIKTVALRRSFQRQIHILMSDAVNSMWKNMVKGPLQRFNPPKFLDRGIVLEPKDSKGNVHRTSLIYSTIDFQGFTSGSELDEVDFAYGEEDTLIILYKQSWDYLKATYNLSVYDLPDGEKEYGTAVATAEGLQYLLKVRFFLSNSTFSVDEFFLRCLRNLSVSIRGLRPEREWIVDSLKDAVKTSFPESELMEIKELLYILYGYAAAELKTILYTHSWTYDRDLFKIVAEKVTQEVKEPKRPCKEEAMRSNRTMIARGDIPFIGTEAEWWSFSKLTKGQVDRYQKEVKKIAREFLRDHALQNSLIPDLSKNFATESSEESDTVTCNLTEGITRNINNLMYAGDTMVDVGKDMKITSFITFHDDLKLRYRLEAKSEKEVAGGRVRGISKSLIYKMVVRANEEEKSAKLESFEFECMSDMEITATIVKKNFKWVKDLIPEAFREDFTSVVMDDIKKILNMAFEFGVKTVDIAPYVRDWNYQRDYGARSKSLGRRKIRDSSSCPSTSD